MHCTMMPATERDRELVAALPAGCEWRGKSAVAGIRGLAAAEETGLPADVAQMLPAAIATRRRDGEDTLVDAVRATRVGASAHTGFLGLDNLRYRRSVVWKCNCIG